MFSFKNAVVVGSIFWGTLSGAAQAIELDVPSGSYALEPTHASLTWKINHMGLSNYTARFTKFDVSLDLNVDNPEKSKVAVSIDPTSVKTDYPGEVDFDKEVSMEANFLNAEIFPTIEFVSRKVELTGETTALIHGDVTMLGVKKPMTLEAKFNGAMAQHPYAKVPAVGFSAEGSIKRSEFGFTYLLPYIGDDVSFIVEAEFLKAQ